MDSHEKQSPQRFARYAAMLIMFLTLGVGQMWADMGFENSNNGILFSRTPLGGSKADYRVEHGRTNSTQDAGNVSALTMKEWYAKLYQNEDNIWGDGHMYYRIYLKDSSAPGFTTSNKSYYNWNSWNSGWRYPTFGNNSLSVNVLSGLASGIYYFEYYFDATATSTLYCSNNSNNFKVQFTIKPNALTSFNVSRSGYSAGTGTSEDPYIIARGGSLTLTASGSGGTSDANSSIKYKYGSDDWTTSSKTISNITSTTRQSITVKGARRHNSQDLGSDESSVTIYYKAETTYSVTVTNGTPASVYAGANYTKPTITASSKTGYHFDHWSTTGGASVASTTTSPTTVTATATGTVTANYEPNTYTITLDDNGSYQGNGSATATYDSGTLTGLSHASRTGWTPAGYYTGTSTGSMVIDAAGNLVANVSTYTDASGNWIKAANTTLYARWKQTYSVTYYPNFPEGTTTSGAAPTDANEYNSGATVTVLGVNTMTATGYSFAGWNTNAEGTGTSRAAGSTFSISGNTPLYAQWTENKRNVTISAGTGGSVNVTSASVGVATSVTATATALPGYKFSSWTATNCSVTSTTSASTTLKGDGNTGSGTLVANFVRTYAFIEGRFQVYNAARNTRTNTALDNGGWNDSQCYIPFSYDETNHRFYLHTYSTPKELSGNIQSNAPVFYMKTSTDDDNLENVVSYKSSTSTTITTAGSGNKKTLYNHSGSTATNNANLKFSSTDNTGYAVIYFDEASIWYELEQRLLYNGNGNTGGSAPSNNGNYFTKGTTATTGSNAYTKTGYHFTGWKVNNAGDLITAGSSVTMNSNITLYAQWEANTYTVSFNVNGGSASTPDSKEVTYGAAYGELPGGMTHESQTFVGWFTESSGGTQVTAETIVSTASNHILYAHYENVYSVNVNFKSGSTTIYPSTSVNASPTSLAPTITAPEIFGYSFVNWTGSDATFGNPSSATTTVNATAATTVTANYNVVPTVYFKNNLGWDSVFVSFNITWIEKGGKQVPVNKDKPYYKMTQIGSSDIYYCVIPSTYTANNYAGWAWNIAFDNTNYGKTATTTHSGTWNEFYGGECVGRGDFDPKATLYIPYNGDTETRNTAKFYKTGCWMKYNSTESGYQVNMNTWVTEEHADTLTVPLTAANAGGYEFSAKLNLKHPNYTYGFKLYKIYQKSDKDLWYTNTGTIYANTETLPWDFHSGTDVTSTSTRCGLHTEALGDYTITVSFATGRPMVNVEYPTQVGDWRLAYNDLVAWSGTTHEASWYLYSRVIKAKANAVDTVSFYVSKATGANAHIELQKCTAINHSTGAETWTKQGSDLDLSSITGTGIYNFKVTQNGSKEASAVSIGGYEGNFYIRTDVSDGGWTNYKNASNVMTYSEYAENNSGFTHYYMRYVKNTGTNIKFCIANDYSPRLTEYCIDDDYTGEYIAAYGNVRFMWDHRTNKVSRAYISGSTNVGDRFLVLEGSAKMFDENGNALNISGLNANEMKFSDDQNWIYEATIKAKPGAKALLTAKYNNKIQYFGGSGPLVTDSVLLLGGSDTNKYKIRVVYDFKTNRLIKAFIPDGAIGTDLAIKADLMIIREHQDDAHQVTFSGSGKLSEVKTVYGAMKFNKYTVNGKSKESGHAATGDSRYKRDLFYISFPFDVKLNEAFGFGTYGKHWIIEYYDGKGRAKNGYWAESGPNWKFVTPSERNAGYTMKAFEGYILALELDEMAESASIWDNGVQDVYIYFPSNGNVNDIQATNRLISISQEGYECTIDRSAEIGGSGEPLGPEYNRTIKDSYWHCIGVPSFANYSRDLYETNGGTKIDWRSTSMPYLYEWNWADNTLSVTSSATFNFKATWSYLVQYAGEHIYWSSVNATPAPIVARERTAPKNAEFRIELQKAGEKADQTFVRFTEEENVTTGFDFNYDLSKEFNRNLANIYTLIGTEPAAGNVLPLTDQTTVVPVGVIAKTDGDYTFSIPDGTEGIGVTLIDNETGIRTSLSAVDYTINLSAGTYDDRFLLEISPIKHVATDIETVNEEGVATNGARKIMIDGLLYIVKDGKVFDAQGRQVK